MTLRQNRLIRNKLFNSLMTALFMGGMLLLLGLLGMFFAGTLGLVLLTGFFVLSMSVITKIPPRLVLRMQGARLLNHYEHPTAHRIVHWLAQRAGLSHVPSVYLIPSPVQNALTTGSEANAAIGVTAGILNNFPDRELAGILAHEISHIKNRDTLVMGMAAVTGRFTYALSQIGLLLLLINLPLVLVGYVAIPWFVILLLLFAPAVHTLLTLGLSRTREFEADLAAAHLTGDPIGLASALKRLEQTRKPWWASLFIPMRREPQSRWLRTHPSTDERVRRLMELKPEEAPMKPVAEAVWPPRMHSVPRFRRFVFDPGL